MSPTFAGRRGARRETRPESLPSRLLVYRASSPRDPRGAMREAALADAELSSPRAARVGDVVAFFAPRTKREVDLGQIQVVPFAARTSGSGRVVRRVDDPGAVTDGRGSEARRPYRRIACWSVELR